MVTLRFFYATKGTEHIYEANVSPQKASDITSRREDPDYWTQVAEAQSNDYKTRNAIEVLEDMEESGTEGVPQQLREIIEFALDLAEEARDG